MKAAEEATIFESVNIHLEEFCGCCYCCYTPFGEALEKAEIISEKISTQEDSIIDRFNTQGKEKGYFVEWYIENQPESKRVGFVKLNLTRRREFCADNGIEFVSPFGRHFGSATASMTNPDPFPIVSNQLPSYNETFMNYSQSAAFGSYCEACDGAFGNIFATFLQFCQRRRPRSRSRRLRHSE